jgi:hypothetical protein
MRKLIVLVEAFALTAVTVTAITMNSQTAQMMVAASQAANSPQEGVIGGSLPSLKRLAPWLC